MALTAPEVGGRALPGVSSRALPPASLDSRAWVQLALAIAVSVGLGTLAAATGGWKVPAVVLAVAALLTVGFLRPMVFLALFVLIRPMISLVSSNVGQLANGVTSANLDGLLALLLIAVLVALAATGRIRGPQGTLPFAWVLLMSAVAAAYAFATLGGRVHTDPLSEFFRLASLLAIFVLAANLFGTVRRSQTMFKLVALSAVVPAIWGVIQWLNGGTIVYQDQGLGRIGSTLGGGPTTFSAYLAPCALLLAVAPLKLPRWVRLPSLAVVIAALIGTYSREGWLIFLVGIVVVAWRYRRSAAIAVIAGLAVVALAVPTVHDRLFPSGVKPTPGKPAAGAYSSGQWRLRNWSHIVDKYAQSPLVGFGLGTEEYVNPYKDPYTPGLGFPSHNSLLEILIEGGVMLLLPWIALLVVLIRSALRMSRAAWELQWHAWVLVAIWVSVIVAGLSTQDTLGTTPLMFVVLALSGSLVGAYRARARQRPTWS